MAWETNEVTPDEIQSRVCWYIRDRLKGRRAEIKKATGFSTSTIDRYCNYRDSAYLGSLKLVYVLKILTALSEQPGMVFYAAEQATSGQHMRFLAATRVDPRDVVATGFAPRAVR